MQFLTVCVFPELRPRLDSAKISVERVSELNVRIENNVEMVLLDLQDLPEGE